MNIIDFMNGFHSECENDSTNDKFPTVRQFGLQYPELRKAKVKITLFWGDCCAGENSFQASFYQWLRMVRGEKFFRWLYTSYEGERVILDFPFLRMELLYRTMTEASLGKVILMTLAILILILAALKSKAPLLMGRMQLSYFSSFLVSRRLASREISCFSLLLL